jgi:hypothetical protein
METVFDDLIAALEAPPVDWRGKLAVIALKLASNVATGLAIGLGVGLGLALAR